MGEPDWLGFWEAALVSEFGIVVEIIQGDVVRVRNKLYQARAKSGNPALKTLSLVRNPSALTTELWIIKNGEEIRDPFGE